MRTPDQIAQEMAQRMRDSFGFDLRGTAAQRWLTECAREIASEAAEPLLRLHAERDAISRELSEKVEALIEADEAMRAALGRIAGMEKPPAGYAQQVTLMKNIAREALASGRLSD